MNAKSFFFLRWSTVLILIASLNLVAQPKFQWASSLSSSSTDEGHGTAVDPQGNVYVTGFFYYNLNLGVTNIAHGYGCCSYDIFLTKYDPQGNLLWARAAGSANYHDYGRAVAVDQNGNAYVTGAFAGSANFSGTNLNSYGSSQDIFVAKYDPDGSLVWVKQFGGNNTDDAYGIATDSSGNIFIAGYFYGTATFGTVVYSSLGDADAICFKLSPSGDLLWARHLRGTGSDFATCVSTAPDGNVTVAGYFSGSLFQEDRCVITSGSYDIFLARFSSNGDLLWFKSAGGNNADFAYGIAVDRQGATLITGSFQGTASFGNTNLNSVGGSIDMFLAKYDASGAFVWAAQSGSPYSEVGYDVDVDENGNSYVTGQFQYAMVIGTTNLSSTGNEDVFLAKFAPDGTFRWALKAGAGSTDYGYAVSAGSNSTYITGFFYPNMNIGNTNLSGYGGSDIFLAKFNADLPEIVVHPTPLTVMEGASMTLSVAYTGTGPITNQWFKNGSPIAGQFSTTLNLNDVIPADSGLYSVMVGNYEGSVTSTQAMIVVNTIRDSVDNTGLVWSSGGNAGWFSQTEFTHDGVDALRSGPITHSQQSWVEATVNGPAQVRFYWRVSSENGYDLLHLLINGTEVTNTSGKVDWKSVSVNIGSGSQTLRWVYTKDESESVGLDSGWIDEVSVIYAPAILGGPASQIVVAGTTATLSVTNSGTPPFTYEWLRNGALVETANGSELVFTNVTPDRTGSYTVRISNAGGSVTSAPVILTVQIPPLISLHPASQTVRSHTNVTFRVQATGQQPLTYQWSRDGVPIPDATDATLVLTNVTPGQAGLYAATVSSPRGNTMSHPALLTVIDLFMLPGIRVDGVVGHNYSIQYKDRLTDPGWAVLTNFTLPATPFWQVDFSAAGSPYRFYLVAPNE